MGSTLVFDFDGTIADSFELMLDIAHQITGISRPTEEEMSRLRELPLPKILRELHVPLYRVPRLMLAGRQMMRARIQELRPIPGMPEALRQLRSDGHQMLIMSSNGEPGVQAFLRAHGLESYFDGVRGNVPLFGKAPALRKFLRGWSVAAENAYYIGDEVRDIVAATKVGVRSVAVTWGYQGEAALAAHQPTELVPTPAHLPLIFQTKNEGTA